MDKISPLVSVLMSVYNEPINWIRDSVESILQQTYSYLEFIIILDNPNYDDACMLLEEYAKSDNRVVFLQNDKNIGLTKSLNKGLNFCHGKYIARIDADDIALPYRLQCQVYYLERNSDVVAVGSWARAINDKGKLMNVIKVPLTGISIRGGSLFTSPLLHPSAMIRNFDGLKYDESFKYSQDYALWVSLMANGYRVANLKAILMKYRYSTNQIFNKHKMEQQLCANRIKSNVIEMLGIEFDNIYSKTLFGLLGANTEDSSFEFKINLVRNLYKKSVSANKSELSFVCYRLVQIIAQKKECGLSTIKILFTLMSLLLITGSWQPKRYAVVALCLKNRK